MKLLAETKFFERSKIDNGPFSIVLREKDGGELVTHTKGGDGSYFWGHYFKDTDFAYVGRALDDYKKRVESFKASGYEASSLFESNAYIDMCNTVC